MKKKCSVVMIPTDKIEHVIIKKHTNKLFLQTKNKEFSGEKQHLYLISDDGITEGDLGFINIGVGGTIGRYSYDEENKTHDITTIDDVHYPFSTKEYIKKVIASTDSELRISEDYKIVRESDHMSKTSKPLPQIPESFIKEYVDSEGEIDVAMVEYDEKWDGVMGINTNGGGKAFGITNQRWELKLTNNNEIIISLPEEKMYSKEEVLKILESYNEKHNTLFFDNDKKDILNKWVEENL